MEIFLTFLIASKGDLETVQRLIKSGISVQSVDYDKRTALHVAVAERHLV